MAVEGKNKIKDACVGVCKYTYIHIYIIYIYIYIKNICVCMVCIPEGPVKASTVVRIAAEESARPVAVVRGCG